MIRVVGVPHGGISEEPHGAGAEAGLLQAAGCREDLGVTSGFVHG